MDRLTEALASRGTTERSIDDEEEHVVVSGRPFDVAETHARTVRDGKVIRFESYIDTVAMRAALGREPGTAGAYSSRSSGTYSSPNASATAG